MLPELVVEVQRAVRAHRGSPATFRGAPQIATDLYFLLRTFAKRIGRAEIMLSTYSWVPDEKDKAANKAIEHALGDDPLV